MSKAQQPSEDFNRASLEARLVARAWENENFKQELLSNPKAVWERESGQKAPEDLEIAVLEESPSRLYILLPQKPAEIEEFEEMSDLALEAIAGGAIIVKGLGKNHVVLVF
jgi:hypothetical protein